MSIKPLKEVLEGSLQTIKKYQSGLIKQIKTNREWLDHQGGITPKSIITIVGASFGGKSTELENLKADIMSLEINPQAEDFVWVSNSFEMTNFATTLRDIKKLTKKDFGKILQEDFSEEEKKILRKYHSEKTDGRFYVNQVPQTSKEFITSMEEFLEQHKERRLVVMDLDHIGLIRASNENKKLAVDDVIEGLNELKNKYDNFVVVILCQLNRNILGRLKPKSNEAQIRRDDMYLSDTIYQISDHLYGLQNASYLGMEEYRKINPDRYPHLAHRFTDEDQKGKVSLISEGCIFVEVLKDRTADIGFTDLFTIEIKPFEKTKDTFTGNSFKMPVFDKVEAPPVNFDLANAFDDTQPDEEDNAPF